MSFLEVLIPALAALAARVVAPSGVGVVAAATGVRFEPSFRAARRAEGVVPMKDFSTYVTSPHTSAKEIRAMLNGLASTHQLEAATRVLGSYLAQRPGGGDSVRSRRAVDSRRAPPTTSSTERLATTSSTDTHPLGAGDRTTCRR